MHSDRGRTNRDLRRLGSDKCASLGGERCANALGEGCPAHVVHVTGGNAFKFGISSSRHARCEIPN